MNLTEFLDSSPSPHHAVETSIAALGTRFTEYNFSDSSVPAIGFHRFEGSLVAWVSPESSPPKELRIVGAHTDSPTLRLRPTPDDDAFGFGRLVVEVYGGVLLNSWLDRDLSIAGKVVLRDGTASLIQSSEAIARIPQLAIHLDREVNDRGLLLDRHNHLRPIWNTVPGEGSFREWVARNIDVEPSKIASWSISFLDAQPAAVIGADSSLISSGRLDNLISCWAAVQALANCSQKPDTLSMIALFDHEEVGSESVTGAAGPLLERLLRILGDKYSLTANQRYDLMQRALFVSADNAHGVHPNYPEKHDPLNAPIVNKGLAIKINENQRYGSSPETTRRALNVCEQAGVAAQVFVSRNNIPCGSTIGPISATRLGIPVVDIGVPQLSMHSAREIAGMRDCEGLEKFCRSYLDAAS